MKYQELQIEKQLLKSPIDTAPLNVLQRNCITHLKQTQQNNIIFYRSLDTHQQQLRVIIFSILIKIYSCFSIANAQRLQKLKSMVYNSSLNSQLTESRGIQKKELMMLFAQKIATLVIGSSIQMTVYSLFNSYPFFQEILLVVFEQALAAFQQQQREQQQRVQKAAQGGKPLPIFEQGQLQGLLAMMRKEFKLNLRILSINEPEAAEGDSEIILYRINEHLCKKSTRNIDISSVSSSSIKESAEKEPEQKALLLQSIKMNNSASLEEMSPLLFSAKKKSSHDCSPGSGKKVELLKSREKKQKKRESDESSSIFSLFCCCN